MSNISYCKMWRSLLLLGARVYIISFLHVSQSFFSHYTYFCYASLQIRRYFCAPHCSTLLFFFSSFENCYMSIQWVPREIQHSFHFSRKTISTEIDAQWQQRSAWESAQVRFLMWILKSRETIYTHIWRALSKTMTAVFVCVCLSVHANRLLK